MIEVLAATALLGGVLSASVAGVARLQAKENHAQQRIRGVSIADQLLVDWRVAGSIPRAESGEMSETRWRWETGSQPISLLDDLEAEIVTLDVFAPGNPTPVASVQVIAYSGSARAPTGEVAP